MLTTPKVRLPGRGMGNHALQRTRHLFRPFRGKLLLAALCIACTGFTISLMPLFTKSVIDQAIPQRNFRMAALIMGSYVLLMCLRMCSWYVGQSILLPIRERIIYRLRCMVFARLQELCLRFHQRYSPGFLYDRTLGGASTAVGTFLTMLFNTVVVYGCVIIFSIAICVKLHLGLTLWVLAMSIGYVATAKHFGKRIHALTRDFNRQSNEFAGQITDMLRGIKTIKAFAMEQRMISEFDEQLWPLQLRSLDINKETMRMAFIGEGMGYLINGAVVVFGAYLIIHNVHGFQLGTLVAFTAYQTSLIGMFNMLTSVAPAYGAAVAGLEQIYEVLDEKPTVKEQRNAVMPAHVTGELTLEDIHFSYTEKPVIQGLSCVIPHGQSVALVGPSGGGKSTLVNLLLRFYDPNQGSVLLDGQNIRQLPLAEYRSLFGVVLQDPFLFNDSIYHNLRAVAPEATDAELHLALERAQADKFVMEMDGGWDFVVGEGGSQLSGGQRQRIALARCFLTNPRIMILDEATSALDNQAESLVQQALQEVMQGRTVFVIAHRLSTVRAVDRILVLQEGQIVQDGDYAALSRTPGLFRDLLSAALDPELPDLPVSSE